MGEPNLMMPGNPRYQPLELRPFFGYDRMAHWITKVELAGLHTLGEMLVIPATDYGLLDPELERRLLAITTTQMDEREWQTRHDIRALVQLIQEDLPEPLRRWVHVPFTSYDAFDTARAIMYRNAHTAVVQPKLRELIAIFADLVREHANCVQIGRTHGQHALPVTIGFWLANILSRLIDCTEELDRCHGNLTGKISGAVGAYNAQVGMKIDAGIGVHTFEQLVLGRLDLEPARISSQVLPPEALTRYLHACLLASAVLGQFGRDGRNLMRTEIAEIREPFSGKQVGSSTMAHKRNPITFENLEGTLDKSVAEYGKVISLLVTEHQRDLVGSSVARDLPIMVINLVHQINALLKPGGEAGRPFLRRLVIETDRCEQNVGMSGDLTLAEPMYLLLQMYGYTGDAHEVVNHRAVPQVGVTHDSLYQSMVALTEGDAELRTAWEQIPSDLHALLQAPAGYTGNAAMKAEEIAEIADAYLAA